MCPKPLEDGWAQTQTQANEEGKTQFNSKDLLGKKPPKIADPNQKDVQNQEPEQNANKHKNKQASREARDRLHMQQWLNAEPEIAEKQTTE